MSNVPFPNHLFQFADEEQKRQGLAFWQQLNQLAAQDPHKYQEKIKETIDQVTQATQADRPRVSMEHCFTYRTVLQSTQQHLKCYINVLQCPKVHPMKENAADVPMLLSRERILHNEEKVPIHVYDMVLHPSTIFKTKKDGNFRRSLQELILRSVGDTGRFHLILKELKTLPDYYGKWLWKEDGTQKTDEELEDIADMTTESILQKWKTLSDSAKSDPTQEDVPDIQLGDLNINKEIGLQSKDTTRNNKPLIQELTSEASEGGDPGKNEIHWQPITCPYIFNETSKTFSVKIELPPQFTAWNYQAALDPLTKVLEFISADSSLPNFFVGFFETGAELRWHRFAPSPQDALIGVDDLNLRYVKKARSLSITFRKGAETVPAPAS